MKILPFTICFLLGLQSIAQVKEFNLLGKNWFVHGIDMRFKVKFDDNGYYQNICKNASFTSTDLPQFQEYYKTYDLFNHSPARLGNVSHLSTAIVLRPFHKSKYGFFRSIELSHGLDLERTNTYLEGRGLHEQMSSIHLFRSNMIGYNPRIMLSSPTVASSLKFYLIGEGYFQSPIHNQIFSDLNPNLLVNEPRDFIRVSQRYNSKIGSSFLNYAYGGGLGIKMNVTCKLNFHLESSFLTNHTYHFKNGNNFSSGRALIQFGLRYKYGVTEPEDIEDSTDKEPKLFW